MTQSPNDSRPRASHEGMNKPGLTGLPRLIAATNYSIKGFKAAWQSEEAFRTETCLVIVFAPLSFIIGQTLSHQFILLFSCVLVIFAELINTAIEYIVDRISTDMHTLSGQAKDIGSACVMLSLILFVLIWSISFWHYFFN
jgi:diacylglycerol kinase (ATP)